MAKQVSLAVNGISVEMNPFVQGFVEHVVEGVIGALHGTGPIGTLQMAIDKDQQVAMNLNNAQVPLSPFVNKIVYGTIAGMVAQLKEVGQIDTLKIDIKS